MSKEFWKESAEVLYSRELFANLNMEDITSLKAIADSNPRNRVRICFHQSPNDELHEMVIVHKKNCYVRPHSHRVNRESIHIIEGEADLVLFNSKGVVANVFQLGPLGSSKFFYHQNNVGDIHTFLIRSEYLVFKEVTRGPFVRNNILFPSWAPEENSDQVGAFCDKLAANVEEFLEIKNAP